jgi:hypothetical protein
MVVSCYFLEVGQSYLADDAAWMTPAIIKSCVLHTIEGVWSRMLSVFLHHLLKIYSGLAQPVLQWSRMTVHLSYTQSYLFY